jgi:hypothetical protein
MAPGPNVPERIAARAPDSSLRGPLQFDGASCPGSPVSPAPDPERGKAGFIVLISPAWEPAATSHTSSTCRGERRVRLAGRRIEPRPVRTANPPSRGDDGPLRRERRTGRYCYAPLIRFTGRAVTLPAPPDLHRIQLTAEAPKAAAATPDAGGRPRRKVQGREE